MDVRRVRERAHVDVGRGGEFESFKVVGVVGGVGGSGLRVATPPSPTVTPTPPLPRVSPIVLNIKFLLFHPRSSPFQGVDLTSLVPNLRSTTGVSGE